MIHSSGGIEVKENRSPDEQRHDLEKEKEPLIRSLIVTVDLVPAAEMPSFMLMVVIVAATFLAMIIVSMGVAVRVPMLMSGLWLLFRIHNRGFGRQRWISFRQGSVSVGAK